MSGDFQDLVQTLETIWTGIDDGGTIRNELEPNTLSGNHGDVCVNDEKRGLIMIENVDRHH